MKGRKRVGKLRAHRLCCGLKVNKCHPQRGAVQTGGEG